MAINKTSTAIIIALIFLCFFSHWASHKSINTLRSVSKNQIVTSQVTRISAASLSAPEDKIIANNPVDLQFVNPDAPCPTQQFSCFAAQTSRVVDKNCPSYKPLWVYVSKDNGSNWIQAGCYATEIDARKALNKALETEISKNNPSADVTGIQNNEKNIAAFSTHPGQDISGNQTDDILSPQNPGEPKSETANIEARIAVKENDSTIEADATEPKIEAIEYKEKLAIKSSQQADLTVHFKLLFGLISVEKRTYPDAIMKEKAIDMWSKGQQLLEPNGTVNEKYAVKIETNNSIIGH